MIPQKAHYLVRQNHLKTLPLFNTYIGILLQGLDYIYIQAHAIHISLCPLLQKRILLTLLDLKLDNIMITIEN